MAEDLKIKKNILKNLKLVEKNESREKSLILMYQTIVINSGNK